MHRERERGWVGRGGGGEGKAQSVGLLTSREYTFKKTKQNKQKKHKKQVQTNKKEDVGAIVNCS